MKYIFSDEISVGFQAFVTESLERSYDVESIRFISDREVEIVFNEQVNESSVSEQLEELSYISRSISKEVLFENKTARKYSENPMEFLTETQNVKQIGDGLFVLQKDFLKIFNFFNQYWKDIADRYNCMDQDYPVLWPVDLFRKIDYFSDFPQQAIMAQPIKNNYEDRHDFSQKYAKHHHYHEVSTEHFDTSKYGLQCAVCDICYYSLENTTDFENTSFTIYNKVFRNESSKINSLDRLTNYSVRDIIFVGDQKYVMTMREKMLDESIEFLKLLGVDCRLCKANDPFFTNESMIKNIFQSSMDLKHELLVRLDFNDNYIAVGSVNLHQDFFGSAFNIKLGDGSKAWSACLGIGFERLVYALYCQYGTDFKEWPDHIVKMVGLNDD